MIITTIIPLLLLLWYDKLSEERQEHWISWNENKYNYLQKICKNWNLDVNEEICIKRN